MADPLPGVQYRIQNVDYQTYLELVTPQVSSGATIGLRPLKDNQTQYWEFEQYSNTNTYYIKNSFNPSTYLYLSSSACYGYPKSSCQPFQVPNQTSFLSSTYSGYTYYVQALDASKFQTNPSQTGLDDQRWQLVPVTPFPGPTPKNPLPSGRYRIRSFNGMTLLTMPTGDASEQSGVYARQQAPSNSYQQWTVTLLKSGRFTISNVGNTSAPFLGCAQAPAAVQSGDNVIGLNTSFEWELRSVGGFAWSVCIPQSALSLGVANFEVIDEDMITLRTSDSTPSQIWFFESALDIGNDEAHAKQEIPAGKYRLQSARDPAVFASASTTRPYYITSGKNDTTTKFQLQYTTGAKFTLTEVGNSLPVTILQGKLVFGDKGTEFVLLEKSDGDPGYYIYLPNTGSSRQVVSGRLVDDKVVGDKLFAIDNMEEGEPLQMWNFVA